MARLLCGWAITARFAAKYSGWTGVGRAAQSAKAGYCWCLFHSSLCISYLICPYMFSQDPSDGSKVTQLQFSAVPPPHCSDRCSARQVVTPTFTWHFTQLHPETQFNATLIRTWRRMLVFLSALRRTWNCDSRSHPLPSPQPLPISNGPRSRGRAAASTGKCGQAKRTRAANRRLQALELAGAVQGEGHRGLDCRCLYETLISLSHPWKTALSTHALTRCPTSASCGVQTSSAEYGAAPRARYESAEAR